VNTQISRRAALASGLALGASVLPGRSFALSGLTIRRRRFEFKPNSRF